jgi:uncharacterized protein YqfB (UPF0267 family)
MVIGFKKQFVPKILDGTKKHTIREDATNRWKEGRVMDMATGVRTKQYNKFTEQICTGIQTILIIRVSDELNQTIVNVDGRELSLDEIQKLAWNDGFENLIDFWLWFKDGFDGKILHWTDLRY